MQYDVTTSQDTIVVGFADATRSASALRWAIDHAKANDSLLRVVHASAVPLTAHNAPSASVAQQLGNPSWAALHSIVAAFSPPANLHTVADEGTPLRVLLRWSQDASLVVLGPSTKRGLQRSTQRRLQTCLDVPVIDIDDRDVGLGRASTEHGLSTADADTHDDGKVNS